MVVSMKIEVGGGVLNSRGRGMSLNWTTLPGKGTARDWSAVRLLWNPHRIRLDAN